jgi:hypothetical protein
MKAPNPETMPTNAERMTRYFELKGALLFTVSPYSGN